MNLHLGCGHDLKPNWVNHDMVDLPGVDVVHDLNQAPWPWPDHSVDEIYAKDVLEHLPQTSVVMEEIYRITKPGAKIYIAVPYWNSWEAITDPTHVSQFNEYTFEFFDPSKDRCKNRQYYSNARFHIEAIGYGVRLPPPLHTETRLIWKFPGGLCPWKYTVFFNPVAKWVLGVAASYLNNIIIGLEVYLTREK